MDGFREALWAEESRTIRAARVRDMSAELPRVQRSAARRMLEPLRRRPARRRPRRRPWLLTSISPRAAGPCSARRSVHAPTPARLVTALPARLLPHVLPTRLVPPALRLLPPPRLLPSPLLLLSPLLAPLLPHSARLCRAPVSAHGRGPPPGRLEAPSKAARHTDGARPRAAAAGGPRREPPPPTRTTRRPCPRRSGSRNWARSRICPQAPVDGGAFRSIAHVSTSSTIILLQMQQRCLVQPAPLQLIDRSQRHYSTISARRQGWSSSASSQRKNRVSMGLDTAVLVPMKPQLLR